MNTTVFGACAGDLEDLLLRQESVTHEHRRGREIPEHELVALLGDIRSAGNIDDERNALLLGDLRNRGGLPGIECADQKLRTVTDQFFGMLARGIDIQFGIAVHDSEFRQTQGLQNAAGNIDAALAILPDTSLEAGAWQQHADLQGPALRAQDGGGGDCCGGGGQQLAAIDA